MPKKSSFTSALASIGKVSKLNRLLRKSKDHGRGSCRDRHHHQHRRDDADADADDNSYSSSGAYSEEVSYSDMSEGTPSRSEEDDSRLDRRHSQGSQKRKSRRGQRSIGGSKHHEKNNNRGRRQEFYSPNSLGDSTPQRHRRNVINDDATRMIDLLMRILPLFGRGDCKSDSFVLDTIERLPSHALEMKDVDGNTMLLLACQTGACDLLPILLGKGCSVNARNNAGATCLHYACSMETFAPDVAMALLRHGAFAEVAELQFLCTPLHWAAYSGHIELCAELCRSGALPTTVDRNGFDSIHYAKQNGHLACAQLLLSYTLPRDVTSPNKSADWVRYVDDSTGAVFFHNIETGTSVWGDPRTEDQGADDEIPEQVEPIGATVDPKVEPSEATADVVENVFQSPISQKPNPTKKGMPSDNELNISRPTLLRETPGKLSRADTLPNVAVATKNVKENSIPPFLGAVKTLRSPVIPISLGGFSAKSLANSQLAEIKMSSLQKQMESQFMHRLQDLENKVKHQNIELSLKADDDSTQAKEISAQVMSTIAKLQSEVSAKDLEIISLGMKLAAKEKRSLLGTHANVGDGNVHDDFTEEHAELLAAKERQTMEYENKDQEILSLRQQIVKLELEKLPELHSTDARVESPEFGGDIANHARELADARNEINLLKDLIDEAKKSIGVANGRELADARNEINLLKGQIDEAKKSNSVANGRYEQARCKIEIAEQSARVEKESRMSMESLLEQSKSREKGGSTLTESLHEEQRMAEETIRQLKGQLRVIEDNITAERSNHRQELERISNKCSNEQSRAAHLTIELEKASAVHRTIIAELNSQHGVLLGELNEKLQETKSKFEVAAAKLNELEEEFELQRVLNAKLKASHESEVGQLRDELDGTKSELVGINAKLKEATIAKMELMVAKHDSDVAMENAIEKARLAESKLQKMTEFISKTEELKMSNDKLQISLQDQTEKRKMLHNTLEDIKGRIRVYVRVRPLSETEVKSNYRIVLIKEDERTCVMEEDIATASDSRDWEFDKIFCGSDVDGNTQDAVFKDTSLLITSAIDGFNVCIFAYGQTGSGKTFTMIGSDTDKGIAPRVAHDLFQKLRERETIHHIEVSASILELYSDKLRDLLVPGNEEFHDDLKIRLAEHTSSGLVEVEGAKSERAANAKELLDIFDRGAKGRASSSTKMNSVSSRSHMIMTIVLTFRNKRTNDVMHGKLTLVDLAGSERVSKSGAAGQQLKEAQSINKSLSALGDVIGALTSKVHQHIPYRNNPLTMLMSDSIGGNAKTLMFVCCSPADYNRRETSDSLDFAKRCRNVTNNAQSSNASAHNAHQIRALRAELLKLKEKEKVNESTKHPSVGVKSPERDRNFLPKLQQAK